jgi:hypothetical protein
MVGLLPRVLTHSLYSTGTAIPGRDLNNKGKHSYEEMTSMPANRSVAPEIVAHNRSVRAHLGERLRAYYDCMQHAPPADRLAKLIEYLVERLDAENGKAE